MRARGGIGGPLILIIIGIVFLLHTIAPQFRVGDLFARYWPVLLIFWGVVQLIELAVRAGRGAPIPVNGIGGGGWLLVLLLCFAGLATFEVRRPDTWWRHAGFDRGIQVFGQEHNYSFDPLKKAVGATPHIVIESFRGDAKITGVNSSDATISGHKSIHAMNSEDADRANRQTPVSMTVQGNTVIVRCNQDRGGSRAPMATDLELSVPKGASVEVTGTEGDFDISSLTGSVDVSSDNAGVRIDNVDGTVTVDTRKSDIVHCANIKGNVTLRGHGDDVELSKIAGQVKIAGDYAGTLTLKQIDKPVRVESFRTELEMERVPGQVILDRGSVSLENVVGPVKLVAQATDVTLKNFSDALDLSLDKGDVEMSPGRLPLGKMVVRTRSGNIEMALPNKAAFVLSATTNHGDVQNEFGDGLKESTDGNKASLEGAVGNGPQLSLGTDRGTITVRKGETVQRSEPNDSEAAAQPTTDGD